MRAAAIALLIAASSSAAPPREVRTTLSPGRVRTNIQRDWDVSLLYRSTLPRTPAEECTGTFPTTETGETVTFTRTGPTVFCTKSDGTMVALANNLPRINAAGLVIESTRFRPLTRTQELDLWTATNATVTANNATAPDGTATAETVVSTTAGGYIQSPTWTTSGTGTLVATVYVRAKTGTQTGTIIIRDTTAGVDRCTASFTATTTWSTFYGAVDTRASCVTTAHVSGNVVAIRLLPGGASTGTLEAWGGGIDQGGGANPTATSYVANSASTSTRGSELFSFLPPATLSAYSTEGCIAGTLTVPPLTAGGGGRIVGATTGSDTPAYQSGSGAIGVHDGTGSVSATTTSFAGRTVRFRAFWGGGTKGVWVDGISNQTSFDGSFSNLSPFYIGNLGTGGNAIDATVRDLRLGRSKFGCRR